MKLGVQITTLLLVTAATTAFAVPALAASPDSPTAVAAVSPSNSGVPRAVAVADDKVTSQNWSGYAAQAAKQFTEVSASWLQPSVDCGVSGESAAAFWIGLDGYTNDTVEQIGTKATCDDGTPAYTAWWQMYPDSPTFLPSSSYPVTAKDTLSASVTRSGTSYTLTMTSSAGWTYSTMQTGSDANSSAEWIASSPPCPTCSSGFAPLADFGDLDFSNAKAADGGKLRAVSAFRADDGPARITMKAKSGEVLARPGSLTDKGKEIPIVWKASQ
jgi:Peptidase A4 family